MFTFVLLAALQATDHVVAERPVSREPQVADRVTEVVEIVCGANTLRITGYGVPVPQSAPPAVTWNDRPVEGAERLRGDLRGKPNGVFRISGRCPQARSSIWLRVHYVERLETGALIFKSAGAEIWEGRVERYSPLGPSNFDSFWYF